ncbi:hypothetical protein CcNV_041 [Crangon crangon nudivirus]|uniref:Uncharacterized protein n=1 Tax=Crangon crangon nudivirus TaxID=2880838 RepID=A0AAE8Y4U9_9VIRU|nr:hypothetical protein QKT25_gp041 [Crangon crangon nudivirus]UBZ25525.1 hypothetical protein CcNV_041 [Crangon crangon nudivirus]
MYIYKTSFQVRHINEVSYSKVLLPKDREVETTVIDIASIILDCDLSIRDYWNNVEDIPRSGIRLCNIYIIVSEYLSHDTLKGVVVKLHDRFKGDVVLPSEPIPISPYYHIDTINEALLKYTDLTLRFNSYTTESYTITHMGALPNHINSQDDCIHYRHLEDLYGLGICHGIVNKDRSVDIYNAYKLTNIPTVYILQPEWDIIRPSIAIQSFLELDLWLLSRGSTLIGGNPENRGMVRSSIVSMADINIRLLTEKFNSMGFYDIELKPNCMYATDKVRQLFLCCGQLEERDFGQFTTSMKYLQFKDKGAC